MPLDHTLGSCLTPSLFPAYRWHHLHRAWVCKVGGGQSFSSHVGKNIPTPHNWLLGIKTYGRPLQFLLYLSTWAQVAGSFSYVFCQQELVLCARGVSRRVPSPEQVLVGVQGTIKVTTKKKNLFALFCFLHIATLSSKFH